MHKEMMCGTRKQMIKMQNGKALVRFIEECYQLYEQKMYQAAYYILQDPGYAEDAVQEAFLKLMRGRVYFEDAGSDDCKKYLIAVIRHSAIDIYNKKKKEQKVLCFCDEDGYGQNVISLKEGEEETDLKEMISGLSPLYHEVVECLVLRDMSVKETSAQLGISEANVRKRFERAKKMLKKAREKRGKT